MYSEVLGVKTLTYEFVGIQFHLQHLPAKKSPVQWLYCWILPNTKRINIKLSQTSKNNKRGALSILFGHHFCSVISLVAQTVKRVSTMQETWVWSLGREGPLEKEMAIYSSTFAWKIPWTEELGRLQSMGSQSQTWLSDFTSSSVLWGQLPSGQSQIKTSQEKKVQINIPSEYSFFKNHQQYTRAH